MACGCAKGACTARCKCHRGGRVCTPKCKCAEENCRNRTPPVHGTYTASQDDPGCRRERGGLSTHLTIHVPATPRWTRPAS